MRTSRRLDDIPGFNIDRVAAAAGDDPDVLRLENLDTDVRPHRGGDRGDPGGARGGRRQQLAAVQRPRGPQGGRLRPRRAARRPALRPAARGGDHLRRGRGDARRAALPRRPRRRGDPHRSYLRGDDQPGPPRRGRAAPGAAALRQRRVAARPGCAAGRRGRPHAGDVLQQRLISDRLGRQRRGVGGGRGNVRRARPVAALLGRLRGRALRRPRGPPPRRAPGHARPHGDRRARRRASSG